jgi:GGDEF domain-containing protein
MRLPSKLIPSAFRNTVTTLGFHPVGAWRYLKSIFFCSSKTEIHNKKVFLKKLRLDFSEARTSETPIALLIVELRAIEGGEPRDGHPQLRPLKRFFIEVLDSVVPSAGAWCRFDDLECAIWLRSVEFMAAVRTGEDVREKMGKLMSAQGLSGAIDIGLSYVEPRRGIDDGLYGHEALIGLTNELLKRARKPGGGMVCNRPNL